METAVRCVWLMYSGTSAVITTTILFPLVLQLLFLNYHYTYADTLLSPLTNIPTAEGRKCSPNLVTQGITFPEGDILVEYGDPLEIFCILNPKITNRNSSSLVFDVDGNQVDEKYLEIINNTTLRLYIDKPTPSKGMYYCRLKAEPEHHRNESLVCLNTVAVGFRPTEIDDFSCVSMNWENLTCTWSLPTNYVTTITKLEYFLQGRAGGRFSFQCPDSMDELEHRCFWDRSTPVVYRQPYEYYIFKMTFSNVFGNLTQKFKFYHYAHVIPSKPVNYTIINKTSHSVLITWSVGFPMQNFPPGVMQRVEYQSQWDSRDTWHVVDTSHLDNKSKTHVLNITDLKYAHSVYDIRIYMASPVATRKDKWSKPATIVVKTLPTEPSAPPKTDIGSFEVSRGIPSRDIYVYWQQIPEYMYNGDDFEYHVFIVDINGKESLLKPDEIKKSYARFKTFGFGEYHLKVYAFNEIGYSATGSDLYIPAAQNIVSEPLTFTKIAFEDGIYELSWKQPPGHPKIDNYTIFWCDNKMDRPYQCTGYLNWLHVKNETFIKNITVHEDNVYQFAISANSRNSSSGMVWASCTVIHNKVVGKIKSVWISNIGSTFIELGWKLECSDRVGVITGYRIHYCPIVSPGEDACRDGFSNTTVMGDPPSTAHGNVTGLIPYTTYKLAITVLTKSGEGLPSDYLYNTTLEDAPDPPRNVRVIELTNTSMTLEWDPPLNKNGALRNYNVYYNHNHADVPLLPLLNPHVDPNLPVKKKLENLQSYYNYNISVSACTVTCSPHSVARSVRTLTGMPGLVEQPYIDTNYVNKTEVMVSWNSPQNPRGPIDYYEIMVTHSNESKNDSKIHRVFGNSAVIEMQCDQMENVGQQFLVYVRAVNIRAEDNATFVGQWSSPGSRSCFNTGLPKSLQALVVIFVVMAVIALVFGLAYCTRWSLEKCKKAMDVGVSLPPELDPKVTKIVKESLDCQTRMHNWPPDNRKKDPELNDMFNPPPDQELLLLKKESECDGDGDGDSSGCSSAPSDDSVSSSLTSGTHISDSGTEADQRAESPDGIYMEESSPPTSLRQRNVSSNRDEARLLPPYVTLGGALSTDNVSLNNSEPDPGYPGYLSRGTGYSRVGNPQPAQKGYVSYVPPTNIPKPSMPARGYVSHAPVWPDGKDASTPPAAASPLPAPASKGYVVAGSVPVVQQATAAKLPSSMSYCRLGTTSNYVTLPSTSKDASNV